MISNVIPYPISLSTKHRIKYNILYYFILYNIRPTKGEDGTLLLKDEKLGSIDHVF